MRNNKILAGIIAFALATLFAVALVGASTGTRFVSYPADIRIEGTINLKNIETESEIKLDVVTNFTALVPLFINPGTYDAGFIGRALAAYETIKFAGLIIIPSVSAQRGRFWVNFRIEKTNDFPDGIYIASSELSITISRIELEPAKAIWAHMKGLVTSYGDEDAFGGIMVHARMHVEEDDWAMVHGFLTQDTPVSDTSDEYTFSLLAFRLVNITEVELNHEGNDLYISGLWNVYRVTWTYYDHNHTRTIELIREEEPGKLEVNLETTGVFYLQIGDLEPIEGIVIFYYIRYRSFIEPDAPASASVAQVNADYNRDGRVNMLDVVNVALSYRTTVGKPGYDFFLDVNFDYVINILDLVNVAKAYGQEY